MSNQPKHRLSLFDAEIVEVDLDALRKVYQDLTRLRGKGINGNYTETEKRILNGTITKLGNILRIANRAHLVTK